MNKRILIVDDSLTVRMDLVDAFEAAGLRPAHCATIGDARRILAEDPPVELMILDVMLPDGDGVELLGEIRSLPATSGLPVILLSSETEVRDRVRGLKKGADEYIGKPYDTSYLLARAKELLRSGPGEGPDRLTILIIDDSPTYREELKGALEGVGYDVLVAATGEEGLRVAADERPNAVIVDGVMPGIDGPTVIRRIRLDVALRGTVCLLLTASVSRQIEAAVLDAGADAFLRKEEEMPVILARLAAVLRASDAQSKDALAPSLVGPKKILAVDDSMTYLQEIAEALRGEGYEAVLARSGEEAIELLAVQTVDCVLLDLLMPGMSGQDTCRRIKETRALRDIPIIMLTALDEKQAMLDGLSAGADDYIAKSSDLEILKARVRAQIRRRQFEDENRRIRDQLIHAEVEATEARTSRELAAVRATLIDELEQKNRELEAFSYSVSHDLRAPLRAIEGFSKILNQDYIECLPEQARHYQERILENAGKMGQLIDDLLAFSRLGRQPLNKSTVDLSVLAAEVLEDLRKETEGREVAISVGELPPGEADPLLLRQVLVNLLSNALKYTRKTPSARVEVGWTEEEGHAVYWVRDNGVGFNMKYSNKLFGVFQRLHRAEDFEGTGVGLALAQRIVHRHGGKIWASAEPDKGATFYFTLQGGDA